MHSFIKANDEYVTRPPTMALRPSTSSSSTTCRRAAKRSRSRISTPRSSSPSQDRAVRLARGIHLGAQRGPHPGRGRFEE
eukprot:scaffold138966_cov133-Phaeocystis_antarctica.AAC.1